MSERVNPNPRGWRSGMLFLDLDAVQIAYRGTVETSIGIRTRSCYVVLRDSHVRVGDVATSNFDLGDLPDDVFVSLLDALTIYRSGA